MANRALWFVAASFAGVAIASTASAGEITGCGAFSLKGGEKGIEVIDQPPAGKSIGDTRAGYRKLLDSDGNEIADVQFVATLTEPSGDEQGDILAAQYFIKFGDDWMVTASLYELPNADVPSRGAGNAILVVLGGKGALHGASGTVEIEAGDPPTYLFDVTCPR